MTNTPKAIIGVVDHVADTTHSGDAWLGPSRDPATGASGYGSSNLARAEFSSPWRSESLAPSDTELIRRFAEGKPRSVGHVHVVNTNLGELDKFRVIADDEWTTRRIIELRETNQTITFSGLSNSEAYTFRMVVRIQPFDEPGAQDSNIIVSLGDSADPLQNEFLISPAPSDPYNWRASFTRMTAFDYISGSAKNRHDNGQTFTEFILRVSGPSPGTAEFLIDGTSIGAMTPAAHSSASGLSLTIGGHGARIDVAEVSLWSRHMSTSEEMELIRNAKGNEFGLVILSRMEGSGSTVDDLSPNNNDGTLANSPSDNFRYNDDPSGDTGSKYVYGPWSSISAAYFETSSDSLRVDVSQVLPRSLTVRGAFKIDPSAYRDPSVVHRALWAGRQAGKDIRILINGTTVELRARSSSAFVAGLVDNNYHTFSVSIDGRGSIYETKVDGETVGSGNCDAYATDPTTSIFLGGSAPGFSMSMIEMFADFRTSFEEDITPKNLDPMLIVSLPLNGSVVDLVSGSNAAVGGTITYVDRSQDQTTPRPGSGLGHLSTDDKLSNLPTSVARWFDDNILSQEVLFQFYCLPNSESYLEIEKIGIYHTARPEFSWVEGQSRERIMPGSEWSPGSVPFPELGATYDVVDVALAHLSRAESIELFQMIDRSIGLHNPISLVLGSWSPATLLPWEAVFGFPVALKPTENRRADIYAKALRVAAYESLPWRGAA